MKEIKTADAVGHVLCHDITRIIKGVTKGAAFRKGHVVTEADIPVLLSLGKENLFVWENEPGMLHEDEAARVLYDLCAGENMSPSDTREGKIDVFAEHSGLFLADTYRLREINSLGEIIIATRHSGFPVQKGDKLAGTRVIPLVISESKLREAKKIGGGIPLLELRRFIPVKAAVITTGNEIFSGRITDTFTPIIEEKLGEYGGEILSRAALPDKPTEITSAILKAIESGADMVICTGGMSVDPDDKTPLAIKNTGAAIVSYGAPVLPGAMFILAYYKHYNRKIPVLGLPGCVMDAKRTVFDLALPRLMANMPVSHQDLAALGHGGLCLNCDVCTYPNCGFGK